MPDVCSVNFGSVIIDHENITEFQREILTVVESDMNIQIRHSKRVQLNVSGEVIFKYRRAAGKYLRTDTMLHFPTYFRNQHYCKHWKDIVLLNNPYLTLDCVDTLLKNIHYLYALETLLVGPFLIHDDALSKLVRDSLTVLGIDVDSASAQNSVAIQVNNDREKIKSIQRVSIQHQAEKEILDWVKQLPSFVTEIDTQRNQNVGKIVLEGIFRCLPRLHFLERVQIRCFDPAINQEKCSDIVMSCLRAIYISIDHIRNGTQIQICNRDKILRLKEAAINHFSEEELTAWARSLKFSADCLNKICLLKNSNVGCFFLEALIRALPYLPLLRKIEIGHLALAPIENTVFPCIVKEFLKIAGIDIDCLYTYEFDNIEYPQISVHNPKTIQQMQEAAMKYLSEDELIEWAEMLRFGSCLEELVVCENISIGQKGLEAILRCLPKLPNLSTLHILRLHTDIKKLSQRNDWSLP